VHRLRITPEFSYSLNDRLELGLYLPLLTQDLNGGTPRADGIKLRLKYLPPRESADDWYWGINGEIGRVGHRLDVNPYNAEVKGIVGRHWGRWTTAFNFNYDFKVQGPAPAPSSTELATKIYYDLRDDLALGIESYNGLSEGTHLGQWGDREHQSFLTVDTKLADVDLNLGVGWGYGSNSDGLIIKAVIGVPVN
jgi:hypothetical protein